MRGPAPSRPDVIVGGVLGGFAGEGGGADLAFVLELEAQAVAADGGELRAESDG
jgi:hypothetical protein